MAVKVKGDANLLQGLLQSPLQMLRPHESGAVCQTCSVPTPWAVARVLTEAEPRVRGGELVTGQSSVLSPVPTLDPAAPTGESRAWVQ